MWIKCRSLCRSYRAVYDKFNHVKSVYPRAYVLELETTTVYITRWVSCMLTYTHVGTHRQDCFEVSNAPGRSKSSSDMQRSVGRGER